MSSEHEGFLEGILDLTKNIEARIRSPLNITTITNENI
jgi:hypothetical protein